MRILKNSQIVVLVSIFIYYLESVKVNVVVKTVGMVSKGGGINGIISDRTVVFNATEFTFPDGKACIEAGQLRQSSYKQRYYYEEGLIYLILV